MDGVAGTTVRGIAVPDIGRLDRSTCRYSAIDPAWPVTGEVLVLTVARYADPVAATAQSDRNAAAAGGTRPVDMGDASAETATTPGHTELFAAYDEHTVDLAVLDRAVRDRAPVDVLLDLARRVLARLAGS